jgi:hypothetical protein
MSRLCLSRKIETQRTRVGRLRAGRVGADARRHAAQHPRRAAGRAGPGGGGGGGGRTHPNRPTCSLALALALALARPRACCRRCHRCGLDTDRRVGPYQYPAGRQPRAATGYPSPAPNPGPGSGSGPGSGPGPSPGPGPGSGPGPGAFGRPHF